jgi:putative NADPH-quinone reductase
VYWYSAPPLLKKWPIDVLAYEWAYGPGCDRLARKEIGLVVWTGSPEAAYQTDGRLGHALVELLRPLEQAVRYVAAFQRPDITPRLRSMGKLGSRFTTFVMSTPISE